MPHTHIHTYEGSAEKARAPLYILILNAGSLIIVYNRNMASGTLVFFLLMLTYVRVGKSTDSLFKLTCQPAVGVIGQTTHISCSTGSEKPVINGIILTRIGEKNSCFTYQPFSKETTGDSRFTVTNQPSLELHNTALSDEREYRYMIRTNMGTEQAKFTINVTAQYNEPIITSVPEEIVDHEAADLYCKASGGYPAGTIHWFDQSNTNWTTNAELHIVRGDDGLFTLTSKLSFKKIDSVWAYFRCVVLNSRFEEVGTSTTNLKIVDTPEGSPVASSTVTNSIAGVLVIGSLIVGLLVALLFQRRRNRRPFPEDYINNEENRDLQEPVYMNAEGSGEKVEV